jgi:transposase InsO family protein
MFDPRHETVVYTDASPTSLGSAVVQRSEGTSRIIEFAAKTLTATERKYPQAQREALAAVWAVERFYYYLSGIKFTLYTDYRALQFIFKGAFRINKRAISRAESWALRLQHFNFDIKYIPGKDNIADPLSRLYEGSDKAFEEESRLFICNIDSWQQVVSLSQIAVDTKEDPELQSVMQAIESGDWNDVLPKYRAMRPELSVIDGVIYKDYLVVIPKSLTEKVLEYAHKGHPGEVTMKRLLRERVWWPGMASDIHDKIKKCLGCALVSRANPPIPMSRSRIPEAAWIDIAIDFFKAGPLGELLVVVDYYSRYVVAKRMNGTDADKTIKCLQEIFRLFGNPVTLKSDNGPPFSSSKFEEFCKSNAIELIKSPPHNPSSNGLVERVNRNLKRILQIGSIMKENLASTLEDFIEVYNKRPCSVTNLSPFEMMFKRKARTLLPLGVLNSYWTEAEARERDAVEKLKGKIYADGKRMAKDSEICIGNFVMIKDMTTGSKLRCRYLDKKYQVIDRKYSVLTLKDSDGNICKRHVDHAKIWPEYKTGEIKDTSDKVSEDKCSPRKKRCIKMPSRYLANISDN